MRGEPAGWSLLWRGQGASIFRASHPWGRNIQTPSTASTAGRCDALAQKSLMASPQEPFLPDEFRTRLRNQISLDAPMRRATASKRRTEEDENAASSRFFVLHRFPAWPNRNREIDLHRHAKRRQFVHGKLRCRQDCYVALYTR